MHLFSALGDNQTIRMMVHGPLWNDVRVISLLLPYSTHGGWCWKVVGVTQHPPEALTGMGSSGLLTLT